MEKFPGSMQGAGDLAKPEVEESVERENEKVFFDLSDKMLLKQSADGTLEVLNVTEGENAKLGDPVDISKISLGEKFEEKIQRVTDLGEGKFLLEGSKEKKVLTLSADGKKAKLSEPEE